MPLLDALVLTSLLLLLLLAQLLVVVSSQIAMQNTQHDDGDHACSERHKQVHVSNSSIDRCAREVMMQEKVLRYEIEVIMTVKTNIHRVRNSCELQLMRRTSINYH